MLRIYLVDGLIHWKLGHAKHALVSRSLVAAHKIVKPLGDEGTFHVPT